VPGVASAVLEEVMERGVDGVVGLRAVVMRIVSPSAMGTLGGR
jgi:hypothetical protein